MSFCRTCALIATDSHLNTTFGRFRVDTRRKKRCNWQCAACSGQHEWMAPNRVLVIHHGRLTSKSVQRARCTARNVRQFGQCAQLLSNQENDGDSPVTMSVQGFQERIRLKIMDRLRRFIINQPGSERQEVLAVLMEGKMNMRRLSEADLPGVKRAGGAEDKGSALERAHRKHNLIK